MKTTSSDVTWSNGKAAQPTEISPCYPFSDRPERPTLFFQQSNAPKINFERLLSTHQRQTVLQTREIGQQEQDLAGTDNHVPNPFTQAHDKLPFNSAACHYNQKEQMANNNTSKSNPVIQQQSLQVFAQN